MELFSKTQYENYADILIWGLKKARKKSFSSNDSILIKFDSGAIALVEVLYEKLILQQFNPILEMTPTANMELSFYSYANEQQLNFIPAGETLKSKHLNGLISIRAPESLTHLKNVKAANIASVAKARKVYRDIWDKREDEGNFGWTLCMLPTAALAKEASLTIEEYAAQIKKSCFLDLQEPVKKWEEIYNKASNIKSWLNSMDINYYEMVGENMELKIYPGENRQWIGISGHNIPSFELFLSPDYRLTSGRYYSNQPSFRNGNLVKNITLDFKGGKVVTFKVEEGETFFKTQIEMDEGAPYLGEFSLTDKSFSNIDCFMANTLFDENYGGEYGNSHIALGASYSNTYCGPKDVLDESIKKEVGLNSSALHWDLVNTLQKSVYGVLKSGKRVLLYEDGHFCL